MGIVVMVSGGGSNLQALIDAVASGYLQTSIDLVVSNRKNAFGLQRAADAGIDTLYFPLKPYKTMENGRYQYDHDLAERIRIHNPQLIVLAGWMHILSPAFLTQFPNKVINLHPALPGEFPGTNAIERAFETFQAGAVTRSGCMIHYAISEIDAGKVVVQEVVEFSEDDTLDSFAQRVHAAEHRIIVEAVRLLTGGTDE